MNRCVRQQLLAASLGVSLLQPVAIGVVGCILLGSSAGVVKAQQTLNTESIARIAQAITVRIEGATQGSGVLVKREGNRYTVLTAWHVVSGQRPGEELAIYTPDGRSHSLEPGSIKRVGQVDLGLLTFSSANSYQIARIGDAQSVSSGSSIFVAGFPLPTSSVPSRFFRFRDGLLEANALAPVPNGYQLLYSNQTHPGMSGGAVLNRQGELVGIHASAERADELSESSGKVVATGTNHGVSINFYTQIEADIEIDASERVLTTTDGYLAQARALLGTKDNGKEVIRLARQALTSIRSAEGYLYRATAKHQLGDSQGAIADLDESVDIDPGFAEAWMVCGLIRYDTGDYIGACRDIERSSLLGSTIAQKYRSKACDYLHLDLIN
jgi:hypothetical protein